MSGRTVIVTGASSGIGAATARAFGRAGDRVVLTARRADRLARLAAELPDGLAVPADLTRPDDIARIVEAALGRGGAIDVLVNNAGAGHYDWLERIPEADIRADVSVNLTAPILLTRAVLPAMQARGAGVIINVASIAARIGTPTTSIYNATKFGLEGFSQAMRRELRPQGIHVCVIYPGPAAGTEFGAQKRSPLGVSSPARLRITPELVAAAIVGLADRPRARLVMPRFYSVAITANALWPSLIDAFTARTTRRAREALRADRAGPTDQG